MGDTIPKDPEPTPGVKVKPWAPPGKGPVETERVEGLPMPICTHCGTEIHGPYRTRGYTLRYHGDKPECVAAWDSQPYGKPIAPRLDLMSGGTFSRSEESLVDSMSKVPTTSALGVPVEEIRENTLPSNAKVLAKVAEDIAEQWPNRQAVAGRKDDSGKLRYTLLPWEAINAVVEVLEYGAKKYAPDNWRKVPYPKVRYSDAAMRHLVAWGQGERRDPESGLHHLAHAVCCLLFALALELPADPRKPIWRHNE